MRGAQAGSPDVTVECGRPEPGSLLSSEPRILFEVLSASNTLPQQLMLLDDYQAVPSVQQIVFLEQARPSLLSWTRDKPFWPREMIEGLEAELRLPSLGVGLSLAEIYEGLDFD